MHRIDTPTAQKDKFGAGKNGFTRGNPQTGTPATDLDDDYFDMLQEELVRIVEESGATLEKAKHDQLLTALKKMFLSRANPFGDIKADGPAAIAKALENLGLGDGSGRLVNVKTFTASGTYTPSAGVKFIIAEVLGGGGGGGSNAATPSAGAAAGAGGASGAYAICRDDNRGPLPVVIGAGGSGAAPAVNGANGNPGGTSSIGAVTAPGGRGGPAGVAFNVFPTGGNVASGSDDPGGNVIVGTPGAPGSYGILYSDANATGGGGANSIYGAGGVALTINAGASGTASGAHAKGRGAGGGGAVSVHAAGAASSPGGNGSPGIVIVWEYA